MAEGGEYDLPATQPVSKLIMDRVVAYVEVRSGHDNRSRGVKAQLRSLGAKVLDSLTNEVTHVVFNEGLPSTYKKAKQMRCHLVSVLWIEACKEAFDLAPEALYPPIGQKVYEDPLALKNFKKMKSMQPDFEEEVSNRKIDKILKNIQRRTTNPRSNARKRYTHIANPISGPRKNSCQKKDSPVTRSSSRRTTTVCHKEKKTMKTKKQSSKSKLYHPHNMSDSSDSEQTFMKANVHPQETAMNEVQSSGVVPPQPQSLDSESSNSSSVIFCGVEYPGSSKPPTNNKSRGIKSGSQKRGSIDGPSMSRNEFANHLSDLVQALRKEKENAVKLEINKSLSKESSSSRSSLKQGTRFSLPLASPRRSSRHSISNIMREDVKISKNAAVNNADCDSASAFLMRRRMRIQALKEEVVLSQEPFKMPSPESFPTIGQKSSGFLNVGEEQVAYSQIVKSYDAFAKDHQKKQQNSLSMGSVCNTLAKLSATEVKPSSPRKPDLSIPEDPSSPKDPLQSVSIIRDDDVTDFIHESKMASCSEGIYYSEPESSESCSSAVCINGKPARNEVWPLNLDEMGIISGVNSFSSVASCPSVSSEKENLPSCPSMSESETIDRGPSPVFVINKAKIRRPTKSSKSAGPKLHLISQSQDNKVQGNNPRCSVGFFNESLRDNTFSDSCHPTAQDKKESDPVRYLNKTVHFLKHNFLPHLLGTPGQEDCDEAAVLADDTPETFRNAQSLHHSSICIPPTPGMTPLPSRKQSKGPSVTTSDSTPFQSNVYANKEKEGFHKCLTSGSKKYLKQEENSRIRTIDFETHLSSIVESSVSSNQNQINGKDNADLMDEVKASLRDNSVSRSDVPSNEETQTKPSYLHMQMDHDASHIVESSKTSCRDNHDQNIRAVKRPRRSFVEDRTPLQQSTTKKLRTDSQKKDKGFIAQITAKEQRLSSNSNNADSKTSPKSSTSGNSKKYLNIKLIPQKRRTRTICASPNTVPPKKRSEVYEDISTSVTSRIVTRSKSEALVQNTATSSKDLESTSGGGETASIFSKRGSTCEKIKSSKKVKVNLNKTLPVPSTECQMLNYSFSLDGSRKSSQEAKKRIAESLVKASSKPKNSKVIVFSFLTASEQHAVESSLQSLHGWSVEVKVTSRTTHVVISGPKRTLNMLKGMARGCWLVHYDWIHESSKYGDWLREEKFELSEFSPAVRICRLRRQTLGKEFQNSLFASIGPIFVSSESNSPPAKDLRELIRLCGGEVTSTRQTAHLVVGSTDTKVHSVKALWVLDCITKNMVLPISEQYEL